MATSEQYNRLSTELAAVRELADKLRAAVKPFADTLEQFDENAEDIGLFEWFRRYADEELVYDSFVRLATLLASQPTVGTVATTGEDFGDENPEDFRFDPQG